MKKIAVYCSSAPDLSKELIECAHELGQLIGKLDCELIYGGVDAGLMHQVAKGTRESGGKVIGVVPEFFIHRADNLCSEIITVSDLNTRKAYMIAEADIFIVLPGGLGTIDEWISTASQIMASKVCDSSFNRHIIVYNLNGMYDAMIRQFHDTNESGFARGRFADSGIIVKDKSSLFETLQHIVATPK